MFQGGFSLAGGFEEVWPGPENENWSHHASCSCPIGEDGDPMAVLDSKFRVRGTEGLRVIDASVFPRILGLDIVVPVYIVSEKAAEDILGP
ncbi:alcohol dehydrogenase [Dactylonectria macrodidyma]|uniref:Alcohol dehydrogenase n=1 Tax=Dactylonectria macrodidyma TaxID=307937 RepID=A0A9P9DPA8_9HYPO|nr:alcohol dehydrogenase [Dactylonectria macrodidyma]